MGQIPIGRTIGESFDFALGRYLPILGVIWLPLLLLAAAEYFVLVPYFQHLFEFIQFSAQHARQHPRLPLELPVELRSTNPRMLSLDALALVVSFWIQVGIAKTALGLRTGPLFAYVPVDLGELRVIGGFIVFLAIIYGAALAIGIVGGIVVIVIYALVAGGAFTFSIADWAKPWAAGAMVAGIAAIVAALIYVQVRFTYLLVPASVVEKRFGLWRSWELSRGNFWRIFTVGIGTLSPILVFEFVMIFAVYVIVLTTVLSQIAGHALPHGGGHKGPAAVAAFMGLLFRSLAVYGAVVAAIAIPLIPVAYGLRCSSSAFAYRAMTGKPD